MTETLGTWIDGIETALLPADDRGLQYGDGLYETLFVRAGRVRFLDAHLARLEWGCSRLGIPFQPAGELREEIAAALARAPERAILKLIVTRGSAARRGYAPHGPIQPRRVMTLFAAPALPAAWRGGVNLRIATLRLSVQPLLAGIKHLNRLENVLAALEPGHDAVFDSLLLETSGNVIAGTMSNVFIAARGKVLTAPLDRCAVAGVMRGIVLRECAVLGIDCEQRELTLAQLYAADEVFITNARIGVVPARRVGEHSFPMTETALRLADHIESLDA
jgi:4-amino-4-deoxychorismate lyase